MDDRRSDDERDAGVVGSGQVQPLASGEGRWRLPPLEERPNRLLPYWSPAGVAFAVWTVAVVAAVVVGEVWNAAFDPQGASPGWGPSTAGVGFWIFIFGLVTWLAGLVVGWWVFRAVDAVLDRRDRRAYERERGNAQL
jgi:hypothetical protein